MIFAHVDMDAWSCLVWHDLHRPERARSKPSWRLSTAGTSSAQTYASGGPWQCVSGRPESRNLQSHTALCRSRQSLRRCQTLHTLTDVQGLMGHTLPLCACVPSSAVQSGNTACVLQPASLGSTNVGNDCAQVTTGADKMLRIWNHVERRVELCREFGEVHLSNPIQSTRSSTLESKTSFASHPSLPI